MERHLFTSEAVSEGHPDKICDQISDRIFAHCLAQDPNTRSAVECFIGENYLLIGGEITTRANIDFKSIADQVLNDIGYTDYDSGFDTKKYQLEVRVKKQSSDIKQAVDHHKMEEQGAGDQGMMFGYASNETTGYMPLAYVIAQKLVRVASTWRKIGILPHARPDMKSQVTINYSTKEPCIDTILMSVQHEEMEAQAFAHFKERIAQLMDEVVASYGLKGEYRKIINPSGRFVIGGPNGDTGLTGRKIIVDTYGGYCHHGGGAFSGKDPSKVDRSAAYMARYIAKNLVAAGFAQTIEIQLSYGIGLAEPISIALTKLVDPQYNEDTILEIIRRVFDLRPGAIIANFNLLHPQFNYGDLSNYGHFGRPDLDLPWERLDRIEALKDELVHLQKTQKSTR